MSLIFEGARERFFSSRFKNGLKPSISLAQQITGDGEINLGGFNQGMAHIGGQPREFVEDIVALLVPLVEPMHGEGVAQVMEARVAAAGLGQAASEKNLTILPLDAGGCAAIIAPASKKAVGRAWIGIEVLAPRQVDLKRSAHGRGERKQALLIELRFPERERVFVEVHVADSKIDGLADPQAAGIDQEDHGLHSPAQQALGVAALELASFLKYLMELFEAIDVGLPVFRPEVGNLKSWIFPRETQPLKVVEETSGELQPVVLGSWGLLAEDMNPRVDKARVDLRHRDDVSEHEVMVEVLGEVDVPKAGEPQSSFEFHVGLKLRGQEAVKEPFEALHHAGFPS